MDWGLGWNLHNGGRPPLPGAVVRPDERLSWGWTVGLGAQHVVAHTLRALAPAHLKSGAQALLDQGGTGYDGAR